MKRLRFIVFASLLSILSTVAFAQYPNQGLRAGDIAPEFTLKNQNGESVSLDKLLESGPVVVTWYRGGWCPYCNIALKELGTRIAEFEALGASVVAISPEEPDKSLTTAEKNGVPFQVLTDKDGEIAKLYDIVAPQNEKLPIPATFIIGQDRTIRYAYVNPDYKHRASVDTMLAELTSIQAQMNKQNKLVTVWTSADKMVAERMALMYTHAAKRAGWFKDVTLVIWGPSAKLIAEDVALQEKVEKMIADGIKVQACVACTNLYGVSDKLRGFGIEVIPMGVPLTNYLKQDYNVITF